MWRPRGASRPRPLDARVSLWRAVQGCHGCPQRLRDPREFFESTVYTGGLRRGLAAAARRLFFGGGEPLIVFEGGFAGRSHGLLGILHLALDPEASLSSGKLLGALSESGVKPGGRRRFKAAVAVLDGRAAGPGDIAREYGASSSWDYLLGQLSEATGVDAPVGAELLPPGPDAIAGFLGELEDRGFRAVIIIDDIDRYLLRLEEAASKAEGEEAARLQAEARGLAQFLASLVAAAARRSHALVAVSTSGSLEGAPRLWGQLAGLARSALRLQASSRGEAGSILAAVAVEAEGPGPAEAYREAYRRWGLEDGGYPGDSFPFHASLVDFLYAAVREGLYPGASYAVYAAWLAAWEAGDAAGSGDYILLGDIDVFNPSVRDAILPVYLGEATAVLREAIEEDEGCVRAAERSVGPAARMVYSVVALRSALGIETGARDAVLAAASPVRGVTASSVREALRLLSTGCAHLHEVEAPGGPVYYVRSRVNVYGLLSGRARELLERDRGRVEAELRSLVEAWLSQGLPAGVEALAWPGSPKEVPEAEALRLVAVKPGGAGPASFILEGPDGGRRLVNTVVALSPDETVYQRLLMVTARMIAARDLAEGMNDPGERARLQRHAARLRDEALRSLPALYPEAAYAAPVPGGVARAPLPHIKERGAWPRVREALRVRGKLAEDRLDPGIVEGLLSSVGAAASLRDLVYTALSRPDMPVILRPFEAVSRAVAELVEAGRAALARDGDVVCGQKPPIPAPDDEILTCRAAVERGLCEPGTAGCSPPRAAASAAEGRGGGVTVEAGRPVDLARVLAGNRGLRITRLSLELEGPLRETLGLATLLAARLGGSGWRLRFEGEGSISRRGGALQFRLAASDAGAAASLARLLASLPATGRARVVVEAWGSGGLGGKPLLGEVEAQAFQAVKVRARISSAS